MFQSYEKRGMKQEGQARVVKSETRTVTRGGVTETVTTEVIETYSSGGEGATKSVRSVTTHSDQDDQHQLSAKFDNFAIGEKTTKQTRFIGLKNDDDDDHHHQVQQEKKVGKFQALMSKFGDKGSKQHEKSKSCHSDNEEEEDEDEFAKVCLKVHNEKRKLHGTPALKLSKKKDRMIKSSRGVLTLYKPPKEEIESVLETRRGSLKGLIFLLTSFKLNAYAKEWAEKLAKDDAFRHRDNNKYGENIFMKWSSNPKHKISGGDAVESWYDEIRVHEFGREPSSLKSGHFTQVIWKETKEMGVAQAKSKSGKILVVANYEPAGNFIGNFAQNVPPPL